MNLRDAELIQYLFHHLSTGPSSNTCPRCEDDVLLITSVRSVSNSLSDLSSNAPSIIDLVKLGQPVPVSNLSREEKRGDPSIISTYIPAS